MTYTHLYNYMYSCVAVPVQCTVQPEILAVIKFSGLAPNHVLNSINIDGFKFGGLEQYRRTYMHKVLIWRFHLQLPNLIPRQIFWLYSILYLTIH